MGVEHLALPLEDPLHRLPVGRRLDALAIARVDAHAIVEQRPLDRLATEAQPQRAQPEVEVLVGGQPGIEAADGVPQAAAKHARDVDGAVGQRLEDGRRGRRPPVAAALERLHRAGHERHAGVGVETAGERREVALAQDVVGIEEHDVRRPRQSDAVVARDGDAPVGDAHDAGARALEPGEDLPGPHVGRAVVDDDDLRRRSGLRQHAVDRRLDGVAEVVTGDDDGDLGQGGHRPSSAGRSSSRVRAASSARRRIRHGGAR